LEDRIPMNLTDQLTDYVHAAFSGLYLVTQESEEAEREIAALARDRGWKLASWDVAGGLRFPNAPQATAPEAGAGDPLAVLRAVPALAERDGTALVLLHNYHKFWGSPEVVQTAFAQLVVGSWCRSPRSWRSSSSSLSTPCPTAPSWRASPAG
jgi:hypothetical protein